MYSNILCFFFWSGPYKETLVPPTWPPVIFSVHASGLGTFFRLNCIYKAIKKNYTSLLFQFISGLTLFWLDYDPNIKTKKMQRTYNCFQGVKLKYSGSALMIFFVKCKTAVQDSAVSLIKHSREKCGTNLTVFPLIKALGAYLISKLEGAVLIWWLLLKADALISK